MARETTPIPLPAQAAPSTPGASTTTYPTTPGAGATMRVQRQTPIPSTPGGVHCRIPSTTVPRTPGTSPLSGCSSEPGAFTTVRVHTAKCSECDMRNKDTMLRCPGCTFQVCKPCQDRREKGGRSLTHGNMPSPAAGTPRVGTPGSVVRRRPVGITVTPTLVKNAEKGKGKEIGHQKEEVKSAGTEAGVVEVKSAAEASTGRKRVLKSKSKPKMREATPSDDSSNDDFAPDPGSPTANKRRRTKVFQENDGDSDTRSPLVKSADDTEVSAKPPRGEVPPADKPPSDMTTDELLAHHGVNTPANPYKAHIMSRHEPVVSNPVIQIPEAVKRGFKPRPTAEEIQKNIQDKVRHKLGLLLPEPRNAGDE